jgi:lipopolysaccharide transport system permease protein
VTTLKPITELSDTATVAATRDGSLTARTSLPQTGDSSQLRSEPAGWLSGVRDQLQELYKYRELLYMITYRDVRVRYKQSIMGFMWAIFMPILIVMSGIVVRYAYALAAHRQLEMSDLASVAVKSIPWAFVVSSIRFGCNSLTQSNRELVTKIYFPKEIFPLASVLSSLFDFGVATAALIVVFAVVRVHVNANLLWTPIILVVMVALVAGISMLVAAASLFFRDVKYIVELLLTFGIFFTPVFYDVDMFGRKGKWLLLNPVAPLLEGLSACVTQGKPPDIYWFGYSLGWAVVMLLGGYAFFKHLEPAFAESI